jgi:dTDP-4-dehydrorhamnose reductase
VDVRAVTVWSLFGARGWNTLVTAEGGMYENGAFDVSSGEPRRTAVGDAVEALIRDGGYAHPVLATSGWWRRADRIIYGGSAPEAPARDPSTPSDTPVLALLTTPGSIADATIAACVERGLAYERIDVGRSAAEIRETLERLAPWAIVDAVMFGRRRLGVASTAHAAAASVAARHGLPFVMFSSFEVFDASIRRGRDEAEEGDATTAVGRAWMNAERAVRTTHPDAVIARSGPLLGSHVATDVVATDGGPDHPFSITASYAPDVVRAGLDLMIDRAGGVWHLISAGEAFAAVRPPAAMLLATRGPSMPTIGEALARAAELEAVASLTDAG